MFSHKKDISFCLSRKVVLSLAINFIDKLCVKTILAFFRKQLAFLEKDQIVFVNGPMYPFPVDEAYVLLLLSQCSVFILL